MSQKIRAIRNHIVFQFEEGRVVKTSDGIHQILFEEVTEWGFRMHNLKQSLSSPRWGRVIAVGPECAEEIQPGMRILIENLRWSNAVEFEGNVYWRTDSDQVLGYEEIEETEEIEKSLDK